MNPLNAAFCRFVEFFSEEFDLEPILYKDFGRSPVNL